MKSYTLLFFNILLLLIFQEKGSSQISIKNCNNTYSGWTTNNPFKTDVFVENFGQFNNWAKTSSSIKYAINNSDKIFFTQQGVTFKLEKIEKISEDEREERERKGEEDSVSKTETYFVNMRWEGSNPNAIMEVNTPAEGYYTFGEQGYENAKAKGYKKLTYKNLYPQIDVEYTIPKKGGIKYQIILHPGADVSAVKMHYTGDVEEIKIDKTGNTLIKTPAGFITDHATQSFYEDSNAPIPSAFEIKGNTISFKLKTENYKLRTVIIDPWTITPTSLTTDNAAYDIDFDNYGNVYLSGGEGPFKLSKYSNTGNLLWTFTNPVAWGNFSTAGPTYSRFCIIPQTGTIFIGEGLNGAGPRLMKITADGKLIILTQNAIGSKEIWVMFYNRCSGQLVGFGGGIRTAKNITILSDTNLTNYLTKNFNGYTSWESNDVSSVEMDYNGDFYALMASVSSPSANHLQKSLVSTSYDSLAWDVNSGYDLGEFINDLYLNTGLVSNRANALALNSQFLYSYDGKMLKAWNKTTGVILDSIVANAGLFAGKSRLNDGIAVDGCNNIYVGGFQMVHVYSFDSITDKFTAKASITTNIKDQVYDIRLDKASSKLYICGYGFVTVTEVASCSADALISKDSVSTCSGYAGVLSVNGGTPPYSYKWSNGATTNSISGVPTGTYTVVISDNSCLTHRKIDTLQVTSILNLGKDTVLCTSPSYTLNAGNPGAIYLWSNGAKTQTITVSTSGTYWVEVNTGTCITRDSIKITFLTATPVNLGNDTSTCGNSILLNSGISDATYLWSTSATTQTISVSTSKTYWVEVSNGSCKSRDSINVTFLPTTPVNLGNDTSTCGNSILLNAGISSPTYLWSTGEKTQIISGTSSGTYWVEVSNGICKSRDSINVIFLATTPVNLGNDTIVCKKEFTLNTGISGATYLWSTGEKTQTIKVNISKNYWVEVSKGTCKSRDSINVTFHIATPVNLGNDTSICGSSITLNSGIPDATYLWSTRASTQSIIVGTSGTYWVQVNKNGCPAIDSINVKLIPFPIVNLGIDTSLCKGETMTLNAGNAGANYFWSNNSTSQKIIIDNAGSYWVRVNKGGCLASDTINVNFYSNPVVNLGTDTSLCLGETITLDAGNMGAKYVWSSGDTSKSYTVSTTGIYWVIVKKYSCESSDSIAINFRDCEVLIKMPNVFTPNGDGNNDKYLPIIYKGILNANIKIYNRWGSLVYKSENLLDGWDGLNCEDGTYYYIIKATGSDGQTWNQPGYVLLISKK